MIHLIRQIDLLHTFFSTDPFVSSWVPIWLPIWPVLHLIGVYDLKIVIRAQSGTFLGPHNFVVLFEPALAL